MAINVNISTKDNTYSDKVVYKRLYNQTPLDFAISYLETIEDLFKFYRLFSIKNYEDFYNFNKFRITNYNNSMKLNGFEAVTGSEDPLFPIGYYDYNLDYSIDHNA